MYRKKEMIYLKNIQEKQGKHIPKYREKVGNVSFILRSTIEQTTYTEVLDSLADYSSRYFLADITLPSGMADGEYEYTLSDTKGILSEGVIVIGDYGRANEYDNIITYEQYEAE